MENFDNNPITWREAGNGDAIVFLHAMAGSRTAWEPQLSELSAKYRCIAWDMPGFGKSGPSGDDAKMADIVQNLADFVTGPLGLNSAHFVGLSVGGMILQHFAVKFPTLCRSISILDSSPKFGFGGDMQPDDFEIPMLKQLRAGVAVADFSNEMIRAIVGPDCSEEIKLEAIAAMSRAQRAGLELTTKLIARHDALDALLKISCPALVMAGEADAETPPAYANEIASRIPNAEVTIIPNAGHIVNLENSNAVTKRLSMFFDQVSEASE